MKVSKQQANENRERILRQAAQLFRERGFDGIGVAELMQSAGLTHGGFYGQFGSKEELAALACERALAESVQGWERLLARKPEPLAALLAYYLSPRHRDDPGQGCAFAALGTEVPRRQPALRRAFTAGLHNLLAKLEQMLPARIQEARRRRALAAMATMVGALVLARAVDEETLSEEILQAARLTLLEAEPA